MVKNNRSKSQPPVKKLSLKNSSATRQSKHGSKKKVFEGEEFSSTQGGYLPHELQCVLNAMNLLLIPHLREAGVNIAQFRALQVIAALQPLSIGELSRTIVIEHSVVSRIINQLVQRNLVEKTKRKNNARIVDISLTSAGEQLISHLQPIAYAIQADALSVLDQTERKKFTEMMARIFKHITAPGYAGVLETM